ncbi:MAG: AraC family transcriptional regulator [Novosphingobium sp.]
MAETLFSFETHAQRDCLFHGGRGQEYCRGDIWIAEGATTGDLHAQRKAVGAMAIIRRGSAANLFFRRSRRHIREDATDLSILWFVRRGELAVSNQCGGKVAKAGDFLITRSMSPFFVECRTGEDGMHEVLNLAVPTHILRGFVRQEFNNGLFMAMDRAELALAETLLGEVLADEGRIGEASARLLVDTALGLIGNAIRAGDDTAPARLSIAERRLEQVLRFIEVHLADPLLSTAMVAKGCGISPRYLSFLLRLRDTSFSELVWEQRLGKARDWLAVSDPREVSIGEIAYGVGFKSPAHFSRMFKRVFGANPREYRGESGAEERAGASVDEPFGPSSMLGKDGRAMLSTAG